MHVFWWSNLRTRALAIHVQVQAHAGGLIGSCIGQWPTKGQWATHPGAQGAPGFSGLGKIPVKQFSGRVWGEIGTPKGFLGTIQTIPLSKNTRKPHGEPIHPQSYVFEAPFFGPQRAPGPSWAKMWGQGSQNGVWGQKYQSCVLKNHAEPTGRCPKRSHMLQVTAKSVLGMGGQKNERKS